MERNSWNPFKGKRPAPDSEAHSTLEVSQGQQYSTLEVAQAQAQQYSTFEVVPGQSQSQYYSGPGVAPHDGIYKPQQQYDSGLEVAPQDGIYPERVQPQFDDGLQVVPPPQKPPTPAHPIISNPNRRIECGVWNEMKWYVGNNGMEMTMSRGSTLVRDTVWQVNGLGWGILGIRGKTGSLSRKRGERSFV